MVPISPVSHHLSKERVLQDLCFHYDYLAGRARVRVCLLLVVALLTSSSSLFAFAASNDLGLSRTFGFGLGVTLPNSASASCNKFFKEPETLAGDMLELQGSSSFVSAAAVGLLLLLFFCISFCISSILSKDNIGSSKSSSLGEVPSSSSSPPDS